MKRALPFDTSSQILGFLSEKKLLLQRLNDLLIAERSCIEHDEPGQLEQVAREKSQLFHQLQECHHQIHQLILSQNYNHDGRGMQACILSMPKVVQKQAIPLWEHIKGLLATCDAANQLNGCLIAASYRQSQHALDCLIGTSHATATYDKKGGKVRSIYQGGSTAI